MQVAVGNDFFPHQEHVAISGVKGQNFISVQQSTRGKDKLFINFRRNWDMQKAITLLEIHAGKG